MDDDDSLPTEVERIIQLHAILTILKSGLADPPTDWDPIRPIAQAIELLYTHLCDQANLPDSWPREVSEVSEPLRRDLRSRKAETRAEARRDVLGLADRFVGLDEPGANSP